MKCEEQCQEVHGRVFDEHDGLNGRMHDAESCIGELQQCLDDSEEKRNLLENDIAILRGTAQVQEKQILTLQNKVINLIERSMSNNVLISGITGDTKEENCEDKVIQFLRTKMEMEVKTEEIEVVHRLGEKIPGKLRK